MPAPKPIQHSPAGGKIKCWPFEKPEVAFDGSVPINTSTANITLTNMRDGSNVNGQVSCHGNAPDMQWVEFIPNHLLRIGTTYKVSCTVTSADSTPMSGPYEYEFTVGTKFPSVH